MTEPRRYRINLACDPCRKRKTKCTGTEPCPACVSSQLTCSFSAPTTPRVVERSDARKIAALEERIAHLKALCRQAGSLSSDETDSLVAQPVSAPYQVSHQLLRLVEPAGTSHYLGEGKTQALLVYIIQYAGAKLGNQEQYRRLCLAIGQYYGIPASQTLSYSPSITEGYILSGRSSRAMIEHAIARYMNECNSIFPIVLAEDLVGAIDLVYQDDVKDPIRKILALMVIAFGYHLMNEELPGQAHSAGTILFRKAYSLWPPLIQMVLSVQTFQAGLLLCMYLERANEDKQATILAGVLQQMAQLLGLHRDCEASSEHRRGLFWTLYALEETIMCNTGTVAGLPVNAYDQVESAAFPLLALAQLAQIGRAVESELYSPALVSGRQTSPISHKMRVHTLAHRLEMFRQSLPKDIQPSGAVDLLSGATIPTTDWPGIHIKYYSSLMTVHRSVLLDHTSRMSADPLRITRGLESWEADSRKIVMACSRSILALSPMLRDSCRLQITTGLDYHYVNKAAAMILIETIARPHSGSAYDVKFVYQGIDKMLSQPFLKASHRHQAATSFIQHLAEIAELYLYANEG